MKTLPLSHVKTHLSELVDEVSARDERVVITRHGKAAALLVSVEDLESLEETLEIMSDREFMEDIRKGIRELGSGKVKFIDLDDLDENFEFKKKGRRRSRSAR